MEIRNVILGLPVILVLAGCGSGSSSSKTGVTTPGLATTDAAPLRLDLLGGNAAPASLQTGVNAFYVFPSSDGRTYTINLDTTPSASQIRLEIIDELDGTTTTLFLSQLVTTPFSTDVSASRDAVIQVRIFDPSQANLSLSNLQVVPDQQPFSTTSFKVAVHVTGDDFTNLGYFNALLTSTDKGNLVFDLVFGTGGVNQVFPTGIQVDGPSLDLQELTNAQVLAADPTLVVGGFTVAPDSQAQADKLGALGRLASDPVLGKHINVFLVHSPQIISPGVIEGGSCVCGTTFGGGTFVGTGPQNSIFITLFDSSGTALPLSSIKTTLAHELGHFLSLEHTTHADFTQDDIPDTPSSDPATVDLNPRNGMIDPGEHTGPDIENVMYFVDFGGPAQVDWTQGQIDAMRGFLATRDH